MPARHHAQHRKPSRAPQVAGRVAVTTLTTGVVVGQLLGGVALADGGDWARIRQCESGGNYATNTGNGYYGAYQFDLRTWHGLGYSGLPSEASPATQDEAAQRLFDQRGWQPWGCARILGLRGGSPSGAPRVRASRSARRTPLRHTRPAIARLPKGTVLVAPPRPLAVLSTDLLKDQFNRHVKMWQAQMAARGWNITVDGYYGPESARFAAAFEQDKGLLPTSPKGTVDPVIWDATWTSPVS